MAIPWSTFDQLVAAPADADYFPIVQGGTNKRVGYGLVRPKTIVELPETTDAPENTDTLRLGDAGTEKKIQISNFIKDLRVTVPVAISMFMDENAKNLDEGWNGDLVKEADNQTLNSGAPINGVAHGVGKIVLVVLAGSDVSGSITITGDTIDRNTGVVSAADTDVIVIDAVSTDASTTDAEGNTIHDITDGYITSKWFSGSFNITTADVNLSDLDVYHCSYDQVNDQSNMTMQTFDMNLFCSNTAGWFYAYAYSVVVTGSKVTIQSEAALSITVGDSTADKYYRLRKGNLGIAIDGSKDGFFVDLFFGPNAQKYWQNITAKVWFDQTLALSNI